MRWMISRGINKSTLSAFVCVFCPSETSWWTSRKNYSRKKLARNSFHWHPQLHRSIYMNRKWRWEEISCQVFWASKSETAQHRPSVFIPPYDSFRFARPFYFRMYSGAFFDLKLSFFEFFFSGMRHSRWYLICTNSHYEFAILFLNVTSVIYCGKKLNPRRIQRRILRMDCRRLQTLLSSLRVPLKRFYKWGLEDVLHELQSQSRYFFVDVFRLI